jgi:hypothetical protein
MRKQQTGNGNTELVKAPITNLSTTDRNPYEEFGKQALQNITGRLLKFNKGDYLAGQEEEEIPVGTKLVLNPEGIMTGWVKWQDQKPVEQIMGYLHEWFAPPARHTLGDTDQDQWEQDRSGPRDPWQFTIYAIMKPLKVSGKDDSNLFTFTASSKGGVGAFQKLCAAFGKEITMKKDEFPVVELGVGEYKHAEYGKVKIPVLTLAGWEHRDAFDGKVAAKAARAR